MNKYYIINIRKENRRNNVQLTCPLESYDPSGTSSYQKVSCVLPRLERKESMVSFVSRRYIRGEKGKDSLMVCLSRISIFVFQKNVI